jgi:hypothetical protein
MNFKRRIARIEEKHGGKPQTWCIVVSASGPAVEFTDLNVHADALLQQLHP